MMADNFIKKLYGFIEKDKTIKSHFDVWKSDFTIIHGFLDTQRKLDIEKLFADYKIEKNEEDDIFQLVFCLEIYYTVILRTLVFNVIERNNTISLDIFQPSFFQKYGIENYFTKPYFNSFVKISDILKEIEQISIGNKHFLENLECDFIKSIFENTFPSAVRHAMGEFYTPDWLANFVIETLTEKDSQASRKTYLDPTCGSGTFVFNVIKKFQQSSDNQIFNQVFGIDLNPVSVLAAKTNYLILYAAAGLLNKNESLKIPIFYADAIQAKFNNQNNLFSENNNDFEKIDIPEVDYIVGNPPWVNWEYLPKEYHLNTAHLWHYYNLFNIKGLEAGFIKEDISVLVTYVVLDKFLKTNGKLGFVVKETLFKSVKQGEGFRKFKIYPTNTPLNPYRVDDLTLFRPFKEAVNRTALLFIEKGETLSFPTDYVVWKPLNGKRTFDNDLKISDLYKYFDFQLKKASPSDSKKLNSGWITVDENDFLQSNKILGKSAYQARTGLFTGGANAIFWLNLLGKSENNTLKIANITERAKNKAENIETTVEKDLLYPFLTGRELDFWEYNYSKYILCPHTAESKMYPIGEERLKKYPLTFGYFEYFKTQLQERKGFTSFDKHIHLENYYALQRIGDYTFAPYKVAWRFICKEFRPAVIEYADDIFLGQKNIIPNEKIIFVGLNDKAEAYYLCGLLSSTPYRNTIHGYMVDTQITPSIINRLHLPKFDAENNNHKLISKFCEQGHFAENKTFFVNEINAIVESMLAIQPDKAMLSLL